MCKKFLEGEDDEYTFGHFFLTLEWNLMARSENVADCHAENIAWHDDSLCFNFPKSKCDQKGKRSDPFGMFMQLQIILQLAQSFVLLATFFQILVFCVHIKIILKLTFLQMATQNCLKGCHSTLVSIKS